MRERIQKETKEKIKKEQAEQKAAEKKAKKAAPAKSAEAGPNEWTVEQQKEMETGMKNVPASVPTKERWLKIAESVTGRTPKECFTRYKELCAKAKTNGQK